LSHSASSFILFMWGMMFNDLHLLNSPCISEMKTTQSWCMICLMCCWIAFVFYWEFLCLCSSRKMVYNFLFFHVLTWFCNQDYIGFIEWIL
jgi:hypothetical protein